jgi:CBS domain-containing protein
MRAIDTFRKRPTTIEADRTVTEAAQRMDHDAVGALVVTDHDRAVGIVTDRDLVVRGMARRATADARVDGVMTTELVTLPHDADLRDALGLFRTHAIRRIPVVDAGDRVVGMVSVDDLFVDIAGDLTDLVRPVTGQVLFGHAEPEVPAT